MAEGSMTSTRNSSWASLLKCLYFILSQPREKQLAERNNLPHPEEIAKNVMRERDFWVGAHLKKAEAGWVLSPLQGSWKLLPCAHGGKRLGRNAGAGEQVWSRLLCHPLPLCRIGAASFLSFASNLFW